MKETIESIISIDKKTSKLIKATEEKIKSIREETKKTLVEMESKINGEATKEANKSYDEIIAKGQEEADKRLRENKKKIDEIDTIYEEKKERLLQEAFNKFILSVKK